MKWLSPDASWLRPHGAVRGYCSTVSYADSTNTTRVAFDSPFIGQALLTLDTSVAARLPVLFGEQKVSRSRRSWKARATNGNDTGQHRNQVSSGTLRLLDAFEYTRPVDTQTTFLRVGII